jgi:hypothetical protein
MQEGPVVPQSPHRKPVGPRSKSLRPPPPAPAIHAAPKRRHQNQRDTHARIHATRMHCPSVPFHLVAHSQQETHARDERQHSRGRGARRLYARSSRQPAHRARHQPTAHHVAQRVIARAKWSAQDRTRPHCGPGYGAPAACRVLLPRALPPSSADCERRCVAPSQKPNGHCLLAMYCGACACRQVPRHGPYTCLGG